MQGRFERRTGNGPLSLIEQPRYRAAFDFLRLRADAGEADAALADWWEDFALGSDDDRQALLAEVRATQQQRPRAVKADPRGITGADMEADEPSADRPEGAGEAPKKRRRRRRPRKPDGAGGAAPAAE